MKGDGMRKERNSNNERVQIGMKRLTKCTILVEDIPEILKILADESVTPEVFFPS